MNEGNLIIKQMGIDHFEVRPVGGGTPVTWRNATMQEVIGRYEAQGYRHVVKDGVDYLMYDPKGEWVEINEVVTENVPYPKGEDDGTEKDI